MSTHRLPREYRMRPGRTTALIVSSGLAVPGAVLSVWFVGDFPGWVSVSVTVFMVSFVSWTIYRARQLATTADLKGIQVRGFFRRHRMAWEEIQGIDAAHNPSARTQSNAPYTITYAYGDDGKRRLLPYVDDLHVDVAREVRLLNEIWEELRGEGWTADATAAINVARGLARQQALMSGVGCSMFSILPLMALALLPVFVEFPEWAQSVLSPFAVLGAGWVAVFGITAWISYRRNRPAE
ncbi:PH domain-containing protein [Streptomyces sp. GMY02]|uniref:PH domain-containing protein n=1 Tax=Streptomyces sp. GMY02 TaxID=1333528 RepID=UPI001C2BA2B3|nr:PH domain-containing protein [Streptomyces sp. GMY02]QXE35635.1 PH domain-containing protein [Streptomyces sp. GMY02]